MIPIEQPAYQLTRGFDLLPSVAMDKRLADCRQKIDNCTIDNLIIILASSGLLVKRYGIYAENFYFPTANLTDHSQMRFLNMQKGGILWNLTPASSRTATWLPANEFLPHEDKIGI
ncbi:hypothetical protein [Faecalicatena contorta]|uniref:hypothetical protein n=1 Tax=Faecalicatena contorta TaxID=39482 RepID=UPI001A9A2CE7|nr:hypothetical protein [Faecalicatena contorta]